MTLEQVEALLKAMDQALVTALGASTTFAEYPPAGTTVAITDPNQWNRTNNDHVIIKGNIWVIRGCETYPEARSQGIYLSNQMRAAEYACQQAYNDMPASIKGMSISFVQLPGGGYNSWPIEIVGKLENALQQTPWIVQIRPAFEMGLLAPIY